MPYVKKKPKEYAVYKGEELLAIGTAQECANELGLKKEYISWLNSPSAKKRLATRKKLDICRTAVLIEDDDDE